MGFLDSVRSTVSSAVNRVEQNVTSAVQTVEAKVEKAAEKAVALGHSAVDGFDSKSVRAGMFGSSPAPAPRTPNTVASEKKKLETPFTAKKLENPASEVTQKDGSKLMKAATGPVDPNLWEKPELILANLPQNTDNPASGSVCGAAGALGAAIMSGPQPTANLLKKIAADKSNSLTEPERAQLSAIAEKVATKQGLKFEDLSQAQVLVYNGSRAPGGWGMSLDDMKGLATKHLDGSEGSMPTKERGVADLGRALENLKPGESSVVLISDRAGGIGGDHYLTFGKTADGKPYVYNPDPDLAVGDKVMIRGDEAAQVIKNYGPRVMPNPRSNVPNQTLINPK